MTNAEQNQAERVLMKAAERWRTELEDELMHAEAASDTAEAQEYRDSIAKIDNALVVIWRAHPDNIYATGAPTKQR